MSLWSRISDALSALANGEGLAVVFDKLRTPPEQTVGFTIAVIALGAKMAKADGMVTRDEVKAFREVFFIPEAEEASAARVFNLARQDVAGFTEYAARIRNMFSGRHDVLSDLMEGLFYIAVADGQYHDAEDQFLTKVAEIFELTDREFKAVRACFVLDAAPDPYAVLEADPTMSLNEIKANWRDLVRRMHPDQMIARGVPKEAIRLAEKRLIIVNEAWEAIRKERSAA